MERLLARDGLRHDEAEKQLRQLLAHSPGVIYTLKLHGSEIIPVLVSDNIRQMLGVAPEEAGTYEWWLDSLHPEDRSRAVKSLADAMETGGYSIEYRLRHKNGTYRWVEDNNRVIGGVMGQPKQIIGLWIDITERKRTEQRIAVFSGLGLKLSGAKTKKEAAETVAEVADQLFRWDAFSLDLYSQEEDHVQNVLNLDTVAGRKLDRVPTLESAEAFARMAETIENGAQLFRGDDPNEIPPGFVLFGDTAHSATSAMFVPIRDGSKVIGVLSIHRYRRNAYRQEDLDTLQSLADYCGGALERIQIEQSRATLARQMHLLLESVGEGIYELDLQGSCTFVNKAGAKLIGYKPAELIGRNMHEVAHHHKNDGSPYPPKECPIFQAMKTGTICRIDTEVFWRRDGTAFPVEYSSHPILEAGTITGAVVTFRDITERKRLEAEVALRDQRLNQFFRNASVGLCIVDTNLRFAQVNEALARMNGLPVEEHLGRTVRTVLPKVGSALEAILQKVLNTGEPILNAEITGEVPGEPGVIRNWIGSYFPIFDGCGKPAAAGCVVVEVTQLKRAEKALLESNEKFHQLAENIPQVFWISDKNLDEILYVSPAYERIWGRSRQNLYERPLSFTEAIHPEDRDGAFKAFLKQRDGQAFNHEYRIIQPGGSIRWIRDRGFPILDERSESYRFAGIAEDITERRALEEQFRQAQKMESVGQLAGGVAHDFNNILTIIQGHASLMEMEQPLSPDMGTSVREIAFAAERASNLTRQLLTFSRRQVMQTANLDLNKVVGGVANMLRRVLGEDIKLQFESSDTPLILADAGMMEQILMNLAVNARDAMPEGGSLEIKVGTEIVDELFAQQNPGAPTGEVVWMTVADSGCGIAPENISKIFEPFFTTKEVGKGTGLGLATVYGIVNQHKGWITVQSEVNKGTTFKISFPAAQGDSPTAAAGPVEEEVRGGTETILLVEDEKPVRSLVRHVLEFRGYHVIEADCGAAAIAEWEKQPAKIDLLVTDLLMPGMTGRELAEKLRAKNPHLKALFMSGYSAEIVGKDFRLHDGINFLQKPYPPRKLAKRIRECLDAH